MNYAVQSKGFELSPAQDFVIRRGISKIERYCKNFKTDQINAQVVISYHNPPKNFGAHLFLELPSHKISAVTNDFNFSLAYNEVIDKVLTQLRKHKAKMTHAGTYAQIAHTKGKA